MDRQQAAEELVRRIDQTLELQYASRELSREDIQANHNAVKRYEFWTQLNKADYRR